MIYFVKTTTLQPCLAKIGFTDNETPDRRFEELSTGFPDKLELIGFIKGGMTTEQGIHKFFDKFRKENEWFLFDESMVDFIKTYNYDKFYFDYVQKIEDKKKEVESQVRLEKLEKQKSKEEKGEFTYGTTGISKTYRKMAGQCGHIYVTVIFRDDKPNRIDYIKIQGCTKYNDCGGSWAESIADLLSFAIRRIRNRHEAEAIIKSLKFHRCNRMIANDEHTTSCSDAIARVLQEELKVDEEEKETTTQATTKI